MLQLYATIIGKGIFISFFFQTLSLDWIVWSVDFPYLHQPILPKIDFPYRQQQQHSADHNDEVFQLLMRCSYYLGAQMNISISNQGLACHAQHPDSNENLVELGDLLAGHTHSPEILNLFGQFKVHGSDSVYVCLFVILS